MEIYWVIYEHPTRGHEKCMPVCKDHLYHLYRELERTGQKVLKTQLLTREECAKWYSSKGDLGACWFGKSRCKAKLEEE